MSSGHGPETISNIIADCCIELFEAYDVSISRKPNVPIEHQELVLGGIIGFTGDQMKGTLMLCATAGLLDAPKFGESSAQDWIGELANQLLGRVKNRLLSYGLVIHLSTPVTMQGHQLHPEPCHEEVEPLFLVTSSGEAGAVVWFDVEPPTTQELVPVISPEAQSQCEGELLLF